MKKIQTTVCIFALILSGILSGGATECGGETSPGSPPLVESRAQEVIIRVTWLHDPQGREIEVATTSPSGTGINKFKGNKSNHYEFLVKLFPGQRVSVTADQFGSGYLECWIKVNGKFAGPQGYVHRNDPGSVHCEYTRPGVGVA